MMSEHSLVEVTDVDFFSLKESQRVQLAGDFIGYSGLLHGAAHL